MEWSAVTLAWLGLAIVSGSSFVVLGLRHLFWMRTLWRLRGERAGLEARTFRVFAQFEHDEPLRSGDRVGGASEMYLPRTIVPFDERRR